MILARVGEVQPTCVKLYSCDRMSGQGGQVPFGYVVERGRLVPEPVEQSIIQRMKYLRASGSSLRAIAATLEEEGHRPRSGGHWHPSQVQRILARDAGPVTGGPDAKGKHKRGLGLSKEHAVRMIQEAPKTMEILS